MKLVPIFLICALLGLSTGCSSGHVMQSSESMEAYRLDEETKNIFIDTNPEGDSLTLIPGPVSGTTGIAFAKFQGFGSRKDYLFFCFNTGNPASPVAMHSLTIEDSCVIEKAGEGETKKHCFEFQVGAAPGFQSTWYLWAEDSSVRLARTITPDPLIATGADGATLTVTRRETGGNISELSCTGLREDEQVCLVIQSLGEQCCFPTKVPRSGKVRISAIPSFAGCSHGVLSGTAAILLVRKGETLRLEHDWDLSTTMVPARRGPDR